MACGNVTVITALNGNVIVRVKEFRVAINEGMAVRLLFDEERKTNRLKGVSAGGAAIVVKTHGMGVFKRGTMDMSVPGSVWIDACRTAHPEPD